MYISNRKYKRSNIRKFKSKKFNVDNFVNSYYIEDGNAYLTINVKNYNDIVSRFSCDGHEWIDTNFKDYLDEITNYIPFDENLIIKITGCKFNDKEKEGINNAIMNNFNFELAEATEDLHENFKESHILILFSIISIVAYILLVKLNTNTYVKEVINVAFWFFLWEFFDTSMLERNDLKYEKIEAARLASSKIVFE